MGLDLRANVLVNVIGVAVPRLDVAAMSALCRPRASSAILLIMIIACIVAENVFLGGKSG